jgi:hypothetical protein
MDLFTRIAKANYTSRGYGAGGDHADEMTKDQPMNKQTVPILAAFGAVALLMIAIASVFWLT